MSEQDLINAIVLQEFRLHDADTDGVAARIVAGFAGGIKAAVPLLTSIDDRRDVAIVRAVHAGECTDEDAEEHAALDPLVSTWQPSKQYGPRIAERSSRPPTYYRLAVTESGINDAGPERFGAKRGKPTFDASLSHLALLWIGTPIHSYAGLVTLIGSDEVVRPGARGWPLLPLSRYLGVRIYESLS